MLTFFDILCYDFIIDLYVVFMSEQECVECLQQVIWSYTAARACAG